VDSIEYIGLDVHKDAIVIAVLNGAATPATRGVVGWPMEPGGTISVVAVRFATTSSHTADLRSVQPLATDS